jgi:hypothetical protein
VGLAGLYSREGEDVGTYAESFDRENDGHENEVEREESEDEERDRVRELFSFGTIAESEDDLKREENEVWEKESRRPSAISSRRRESSKHSQITLKSQLSR